MNDHTQRYNYIQTIKKVEKRGYGFSYFFPISELMVCRYPEKLVCDFHPAYFYQVALVTDGLVLFETEDGRSFECQPDSVLILPKDSIYRWRAIKETTMINCLHNKFSSKDHLKLSALFGGELQEVIHIELPHGTGRNLLKRFDECEKSIFRNEHLSVIILDFFTQILDHSEHARQLNSNIPEIMIRCVSYIEQNLNRKITLGELAEKHYLSVSRFSELFRKHTGMSPMNYISSRRALKAQELIENSKTPIYEIAGKLGFEDINYFSRFMKKQTGLSPSQIRKNHQIRQ